MLFDAVPRFLCKADTAYLPVVNYHRHTSEHEQ